MMQFAGAARYAYNWAINRENEAYELGNGFISDVELCRLFTKHKAEADWLYTISNDVTKQAIKDAVFAFKVFFKGRAKYPRLKKKGKSRVAFYQDGFKLRLSETHIKLGKISTKTAYNKKKLNWIKLSEKNRIPITKSYLNPRITFDGIHWYVSVRVEVPESTTVPTNPGIGIDLGIKELAVCSDGHTYSNINRTDRIKRLEKQKRRKQRQIARKYLLNKQGNKYVKTKNIEKAEQKLLKKTHKLTNIRNDYIHQVTTEIINRKPKFIVLEYLNVSGMMKNRHLAKAIQQQNLYHFREILTHKAERAGIKIILADRFYPSSKTCSHCGSVKQDLHLNDRTFKCNSCGLEIDRDLNASLNLCRLGSSTVSSTGINVCGVPHQTGVAKAKQGTMKQKSNRGLPEDVGFLGIEGRMRVINVEKLNKAVDKIFVAADYPNGLTIGRTIDFIDKRYTIIQCIAGRRKQSIARVYSKLNGKELDEYKIIALKPSGKAIFNHKGL